MGAAARGCGAARGGRECEVGMPWEAWWFWLGVCCGDFFFFFWGGLWSREDIRERVKEML